MPKKIRFLSETPDALIAALRRTAQENAATNWSETSFGGFDPQGNQYGFSDLRPTHLGLTNSTYLGEWSTTAVTVVGTATTWFEKTIHKNAYVVVFGIFNNTPDPRVAEMKLTLGGNELPWSNIHEIWGWDIARAYFEQGWIISPEQVFKAQVTARASVVGQTEKIGLLGEILARRSYAIQYNAPTN